MGERNWPDPTPLSETALDEICTLLKVANDKRNEFRESLIELQQYTAILLDGLKKEGTLSGVRDSCNQHLENLDAIVRWLERIAEQQRSWFPYREGLADVAFSESASRYLPQLFDPELLVSVERQRPPHLTGEDAFKKHMLWVSQMAYVRGVEALLPVFGCLRDLLENVDQKINAQTKRRRRPPNTVGPSVLKSLTLLCGHSWGWEGLNTTKSGPIYNLAVSFFEAMRLPTDWIESQFSVVVPNFYREQIKKNYPRKT